MTDERYRRQTAKAVATAQAQWQLAPIHIKAMAGAYVNPLLAAIEAINAELGTIAEQRAAGGQA